MEGGGLKEFYKGLEPGRVTGVMAFMLAGHAVRD